jgi:hypothetical protein
MKRGSSAKPMTNAELVENLCSASVALREARRSHLRSFGTLIPHVFMTDVLARVGFCLSLDRGEEIDKHRDEAGSILQALERGLAEGHQETRNVIAVSFVNDAELELFFEDVRPLLGPRLQAQLQGK